MFLSSKVFTNFYKYKRKIYTKYENCSKFSTTSTEHLKLVFFGTDNFSLPSLQALHNESKLANSKISSIKVVTSFKAVANPVRNFANKNDLKIFKWPLEPNLLNGNDLGIVVSFGHLIPNKIISVFSLGMINVHASLLPRWRGAAPIIYTIMNNDKVTGVTIMKIEPYHFDVGDILAQKQIPVEENILLPELHHKLAKEGSELLIDVVKKIPESLKNGKKQNENLITYAPKITQNIIQIKWNEMNSKDIYDRYRALYSFYQLTTTWHEYGIKFIDINLNNNQNNCVIEQINKNYLPGYVEYSKNDKCLKVYCKDKNFINVNRIKIEGKKIMSAVDFNNGFLKKCPIDQRYFK